MTNPELKHDIKYNEALKKKIEKLKKKRNAVIIVHNYQRDEVQEIADISGDSLALSQAAVRTDADVIVFCGVRFMAVRFDNGQPQAGDLRVAVLCLEDDAREEMSCWRGDNFAQAVDREIEGWRTRSAEQARAAIAAHQSAIGEL